jgi:ribonuclease HI
MNCISWNCRGLGNQGTVQELARIMRIKDPSVLFLSETWMDDDRLELLHCRFHFSNKFVVKRINKGGGLVLFWKHDISLAIQSYSLSHIDTIIDGISEAPWRFTCFYGAPETHLRENSWNLLRTLSRQFSLPWCCAGDFNEIVRSSEKKGFRNHSENQMQKFRDVIDECGFIDLGYRGSPFTWCNNRRGVSTTWLRLDRYMATNDWVLRFNSAVVFHLESSASNHKPIWLSPSAMQNPRHRKKVFRFEDMWRSNPGCENTITLAWKPVDRGTPMVQVTKKIQRCSVPLSQWSRSNFGSVSTQLKEKSELLKIAKQNSINGQGHDQVISLRKEVNGLLIKEEKMWQQRSRTLWLKDGDRNTKYFHSRATHRQRRNLLLGIRNEAGDLITNQDQIGSCFIEYYQSLFTAAPLVDAEVVLDGINRSVSEEMNQTLTSPFTEAEITAAIKQMAPLKAPGPDGMPPVFYQSYWHVIGTDVIQAVLSSLNSGTLLPSINHTFVTLIPKVKNPEQVTDYRPISLCNVIYELISKVLANRFKKVLPYIISETQSAFVPGRLITDNILIAFETLHYMNNQRSGKVGSMALKLDMSKAYDRVEWAFLKQVMLKMGFHSHWVSLIMECISTVSYSLLINGEPTGNIIPSRGLRQGDPISPYLFLLCAEGLNGLLNKAASKGDIHGVSICRRGPKLTHLFFADDSLLFCRATQAECGKIQEVLQVYERVSGQQLNKAKTTLFFSRNTPQATQDDIKDILGVPSIQQYEKYLGLPSLVGKEKISCFAQIKERVWSKVKGWKEKLLSQAGREILIKAVVQAIPSYTMNCFKLPVGLCKDIEAIIRRFWWGEKENNRKIHWIRWEKLCQPKGVGGLGFRELQNFNLALLAKQFWRLMHCKNSLLFKVFSAKFFPSGNIMEASTNNRGSFAWRSILKAKDLIIAGSSWRVGDGKQIPIKDTNWLLEEGHRRVISPLPNLHADAKVADLIQSSPPAWDEAKIRSLFLPYDSDAILQIPLSDRCPSDKLYWHATTNGKYSVRSGYQLLLRERVISNPNSSNQGEPNTLWKQIWSLRTPTKVKSFMWRACQEALPTKAGLFRRKVIPSPGCDNCGTGAEDCLHALWSCPVISQVWSLVPAFREAQQKSYTSFYDLVHHVALKPTDLILEKFAVLSWFIWHKRNQAWLRLPSTDYNQLWTNAHAYLNEFLEATQIDKTVKPAPPLVRWSPPVHNGFKVNFDGALFKDKNEGGIGVVIRDCSGLVIATLSQRVKTGASVDLIEALAAKRAITFAMEVGVTDVEFEGDSENVIQDLSRPEAPHNAYGLIIEDARLILPYFQRYRLSHIRHSGNAVAHALARRALDINNLVVWMEEVPPDIVHVLLKDSSAFIS